MSSIYEIREAAKGLGDQVNRADSHVSVTDCAAARESRASIAWCGN